MNGEPRALFGDPLQLRDGRRVWFRPIRPDDAARLRRFHRRLSPESQRLRFFSPLRELSQRMADQFTTVDYVERGAVVACYPGEDEIRGVGRYESNSDGSAEIAFVLEDDLHGLGVGKQLLHLLADHCRLLGMTRFTAMVLPENQAMMQMFRNSGYPLTLLRRDGVDFVTLDLVEPVSEAELLTTGAA